MSRDRFRAGLTRTEVLALVAVILVALLIIWPLWNRQAVAKNRQISANNLRQWGIAFNLYLGESQNILPVAGTQDTIATADQAWFNALPPYLSQPPLKDLPLAARPGNNKGNFWTNPAAKLTRRVDIYQFTYAMNAWLSVPSHGPYKIYEIENPMAVVFLAEVEGSTPAAQPADVVPRFGSSKPQNPEAAAHFLFCDGHVELLPRVRFAGQPGLEDPEKPSDKFTWVPFYGAPKP
jgi:prepilin-type processing-associated H-X9-DG protein